MCVVWCVVVVVVVAVVVVVVVVVVVCVCVCACVRTWDTHFLSFVLAMGSPPCVKALRRFEVERRSQGACSCKS